MKRTTGFVLGVFLCGSFAFGGGFGDTPGNPQNSVPPSFELRAGVLLHDRSFSLEPRSEGGMDMNLEALLPSPDAKIFRKLWSPRPHVGLSVNTDGGTNSLYGGFTWRLFHYDAFSLEGSLGAAIHDGKLSAHSQGWEDLGSRGLFRMSAELSGMLLPRHGLSLFVDHISNARLAHENDGITNAGIRYLHRF